MSMISHNINVTCDMHIVSIWYTYQVCLKYKYKLYVHNEVTNIGFIY
jgi:hypothetical protein